MADVHVFFVPKRLSILVCEKEKSYFGKSMWKGKQRRMAANANGTLKINGKTIYTYFNL